MNLNRIARDFVVRSMFIGQKPNHGINIARKRFGKTIDKFLKLGQFQSARLTPKEKKIAEKLTDPDYGPLLMKTRDGYRVKARVGEILRLLYSDKSEECRALAKMITEEAWKRGAHVLDLTYSSEESRRHLKLIPSETAAELPPTTVALAKTIDVRVFLGGDEDPNWVHGLEGKLKLGAKGGQKVHQITDKKKVRWCYFGWPIPQKSYNVPAKKFRKVFLDSIERTFTPRVLRLCKYYENALRGADNVTITANDGTSLSFRIKGRPLLVDKGFLTRKDIEDGEFGLNIPAGEVFLAPLEYSANGEILFDYATIAGFGLVRNLRISFKDGKVVRYRADGNGAKLFRKFLHANTGDKDRIAELGIGCNPAAKFIGKTIVDEKIFGSIHIAIGNNTGTYHGKNVASSHLDMVKIMQGKQGCMYVDGRLVMKNGMPVRKI